MNTKSEILVTSVELPVPGSLVLLQLASINVCAFTVAAAMCVYLLPAMIAVHLPSSKVIAWLNIYLGWTGVVWLFVLIWACFDRRDWARSREMHRH